MGIKGGGAGHKQRSSDSKFRPPSIHKSSPTTTKSNQKLLSQSISNPLHSTESTSIETEQISQHTPQHHQVIAVSASKGPAAFFNLARKFLATDDVCDLSALEGAIVSAVDAAHLLERSKIADIVRYVVNILFCIFLISFFLSKLCDLIIVFISPYMLPQNSNLLRSS